MFEMKMLLLVFVGLLSWLIYDELFPPSGKKGYVSILVDYIVKKGSS